MLQNVYNPTLYGGNGENRTLMDFTPLDSKSSASANSATLPFINLYYPDLKL